MKLYEVPNKTWIKTSNGTTLFFDHIDGMYSFCLTENKELIHIAAWTEVEIIPEGD